MSISSLVDADKARSLNPFYRVDECVPKYVEPDEKFNIQVESREMEVAIIKAYDYGIESLTPEGKKQIQRFIDYVLLRMKGKI